MATVRQGNQPVLLVVDVQAGVVADAWQAPRVVHNVARVVEPSNWCIRATAYAALERGYDLTLVQDAHTTGNMALDNGVTIEAASLVHELNTAMTWLAYPGRHNGVATAEAVDFTTPGGTP